MIDKGQKAGAIKPLPMDFIIAIVSNHVFGVYQYLRHSIQENAHAIIESAIEMIWDMITV